MPPASSRMAPASTALSACAQALVKRPEQFVGTMTEKLLTYALGRGLEHYDMPVVRSIAHDVRAAATIASRRSIVGIVRSTPFQMKIAGSGL